MSKSSTQIHTSAKKDAPVRVLDAVKIKSIMRVLPHRYPLLMIDRFEIVEPQVQGVGIKNVSINEPQFQGHFPEDPVMPGVLTLEAIAQAAGLCVGVENPNFDNVEVFLLSFESARFRHKVVPGDQMRIHVQYLRSRGDIWWFSGHCYVEDRLVAEATLTALARGSQRIS